MSTGILHKAMRTLTTVAMMATVATVLSCNKSTTDPDPQQGPAIVFSPADNWTKAVIPSGDEGIAALQQDERGFKVWSWFQGTTSGHMFGEEGTDVKYNGSAWDYEDKKYWMNGTYDFAAVFPSTVTGTYAPETSGSTPVLKVTNFDVTDQDDLLIAFNTGIDGSKGKANNEVELKFQHALSCVQLELQLNVEDFFEPTDEGEREVGYAYVEALGFSDISVIGTLSGTKSNDNVSLDWTESADKYVLAYTYETPKQIQKVGQNFFGDDGILVIPQALSEGNLYMRVRIDFPGITGSIYNVYNIPLITGVSEWLPDTKYIYRGIVGQDLTIEFSVTSIHNWLDNTLGGFNIGGDNN